MNRLKTIFACVLLVLAWSLPLSADNHEIDLTWTLPTHTVNNNNCNEQGNPVARPIDTTVQYIQYVPGEEPTWETAPSVEAGEGMELTTLTGLPGDTSYIIRIGPHYPNEAVLCWSNPIIVTTPPDAPPQGCSDFQSPATR